MSWSNNCFKEWPWTFLTVLLGILTVLRISLFDYGFVTAWDESYFLVKCQEAYIGDFVTGKSLWNYIAIKWFPYLDLTSKTEACLASWLLEMSAAIVGCIACMIIYGRKAFFKSFSLNYLFCFLWGETFAGDVLNYVPLQAFLTYTIVYSGVLFFLCGDRFNKIINTLLLLVLGFSLGLGLFVILPSTILLCLCTAFAVAFFGPSKKSSVCYLLVIACGGLLALLYIHLCICDLRRVVDAMAFTANYITKVGYGYSPLSFIVQIGLFIKDYIFVILFYLGAFLCCEKISSFIPPPSKKAPRFIYRWSTLVYIVLVLILYRYAIKPQASPAMILSSVLMIPFVFQEERKDFRYYVTGLFIFCFPVIAAIGTNTYLGSRMLCFVAPWVIYLMRYKVPKMVLFSSVLILLISPLISYTSNVLTRDDSHHFTKGLASFSTVSITAEQESYFEKVYDIIMQYGYRPHKSTFFTSEYDYATAYILEAKLATNFYQKKNFLLIDRTQIERPDFIFLSEWDKATFEKEMKELSWGYPESYDEYYVGTPEAPDFQWDSNRWLYCLKDNKR